MKFPSFFIMLAVILFAQISTASSVDQLIQKNWVSSDIQKTSADGVTLNTQLQQRMIRIKGVSVPVATLLTGEMISTSSGKGIPKDFAKEIARLTGVQKWKQESRKTYTAYEQVLPSQGKLIKVFVSRQGAHYKYSIATLRLAYMLPTYYETELLQREHVGDKSLALNSPEGPRSLLEFILPRAYAVDTSALSGIIGQWNTSIDPAAVNNVASSVNNVAGSISQVPGSINNLAGSVQSGANSINGLTNQAGQIQQTITNVSHDTNRTVGQLNSTLQGFQDPKTFFKVGLATGMGYTLGSVLVQFATDGAVSIVKKIFYEVTGQLDPQTRDRISARGQKAWDDLEKLSLRVAEIDKNVQLRLAVMAELTGKDPMTVANELEEKRILMESDMRKLAKVMDESTDQNQRLQCASAYKKMQEQVELWKAMKPLLQTEQPRSQAELCQGFDSLYQQWAMVELQMHNARSVLLNDTFSLMTGQEKSAKEARQNLTSERKKTNECKDNDSLDEANSMVRKNDCQCEQPRGTEQCNYYCIQKRNYEQSVQSCLNILKINQSMDQNAEATVQSELVRQSTKMLEDSYTKLARSYCPAGDTNGVCNGQQGSFNQIREKMQNQFSAILKACGSSTVVQASPVADIMSGTKMAKAYESSEKPLAAAEAPAPKQGGGFISGIFSWVKNLFS